MIVAMYRSNQYSSFSAIYKALKPSCRIMGITTVKDAYKANFDYLVLPGGVDLDPMFYGQQRGKYTQSPDSARDLIEWTLIRRAMDEQIPTLGICRGFQLLSVAYGGSLYQDIQMVLQQGLEHRRGYHPLIAVSPLLSRHAPTDKPVNSRHHQTVARRPLGFKVLAKSPDGLIESLWRPGVLGVQWHPEDLLLQDRRDGWMNLFQWHINGFTD